MTVLDHSTVDQIFHQPLSDEENSRLSSLIERSKTKKAFSQQLALDASKLLTTSKDRLDKIKDTGFFKRCWYSFTGKNQEVINQNSSDLIIIQHFAWHYLKELQEQNLIKAQSIATIRNNLSTTNELLYETRDFLEQAVNKIENIEIRLGLSEWSLNIKANKRKFKSHPKTILVLYLIYDFVKNNRGFDFSRKDINHIIVLLEEMKVNCDEELRFIDFIVELINDIDVIKLDSYQNLINLSYDEYHIDNKFIDENISSQFFNALYFLSGEYNKIYDLVSDENICDSDEKFEKIVSKFFGKEFNFLDSSYTFRQIIEELVDNSVFAVNIYKEINGFLDEEVEQPNDQYDSAEISEIELNNSFDELISKLNSTSVDSTTLLLKNFNIVMKSNDYAYYYDDSDFDTGFFSKVRSSVSGSATSFGRSSCTSDLNNYKKEVREFISNHRNNLFEANQIIERYKLEKIEFKDSIDYSDIDLDTSATNENWHNQFTYINDNIENTLNSFLQACEYTVQQLELFKNNEYKKSIVQIKRQAKLEEEKQKEIERKNKESILLSNGESIIIDWQKLENPPCHPEDISIIKSFNNNWLITNNENKIYISQDLKKWNSVAIECLDDFSYIKEIKVIDNLLIIFQNNYEEKGFIYSSDGINWKKSNIPNGIDYFNGIYPTENLTKFKDIWLWRFTKKTEYNYTEKGFFSDSVKKSDYNKSIIMCSSTLDGGWTEWECSPHLDEGLEIQNLFILPEANLPIFLAEYCWSYKSNKKKVDAKPQALYFSDNQKWRTCSWKIDTIQSNSFFEEVNNFYYCQTGYCESFTSQNGFEWHKKDMNFSVDQIFKLSNFNIFTSSNSLYFSTNINEFHEMILKDGSWEKFSLNDTKLLALHSPSHHENYLMLGNIEVKE